MNLDHVINTIPHQLTSTQVLDEILRQLQQQPDSMIWVIVPASGVESWRKRIRVTLAKQRKHFEQIRKEIGAKSYNMSRLFSLKISQEHAALKGNRAALLVTYLVTERQQKRRFYIEHLNKVKWPDAIEDSK